MQPFAGAFFSPFSLSFLNLRLHHLVEFKQKYIYISMRVYNIFLKKRHQRERGMRGKFFSLFEHVGVVRFTGTCALLAHVDHGAHDLPKRLDDPFARRRRAKPPRPRRVPHVHCVHKT